MDWSQWLNNKNLLIFFYQAFAYVFVFFYLLFTIVIYKQTQVMIKTLQTGKGQLIVLISFLQILISLVLIFLAIILI